MTQIVDSVKYQAALAEMRSSRDLDGSLSALEAFEARLHSGYYDSLQLDYVERFLRILLRLTWIVFFSCLTFAVLLSLFDALGS